MDELPPIKPLGEFTGHGFEIIGDPSAPLETGSLSFRDGVFVGYSLPSNESIPQWTPETSMKWEKLHRKSRAERLALRLRADPADAQALADLEVIKKQCAKTPKTKRDRATENAVRMIKNDNDAMPTAWPAQERQGTREHVAVIALIEKATELGRPPTGAEVIKRMKAYRDEQGVNLLQDGGEKNLVKFLREFGFSWLEFHPLGYRGER